ncbi:hypothetical protein H6F38_23130 [Paenibacillus sp. EKM208P]|nr:hypothetical protein H6F38_23130 [Paenibacillus sp. EKM208P]
MLRHLITHPFKAADATFKSATPTIRGRLVQKDYVTKTAIVPTSQEGLFWITKDSYPTGLLSLEGELSDYDPRLESIVANEPVVLETPVSGEVYATSEFVTGLVDGDFVEVETTGIDSGKLKKSSAKTKYQYVGEVKENGHTLAKIAVL